MEKLKKRLKEKEHPAIKFLDKFVYWAALAMAIIGNFIISIALIPSLMALKSTQLFLILAALGISFGSLFELLIRSIEHLEAMHHVFLGILMPSLTLINIFI